MDLQGSYRCNCKSGYTGNKCDTGGDDVLVFFVCLFVCFFCFAFLGMSSENEIFQKILLANIKFIYLRIYTSAQTIRVRIELPVSIFREVIAVIVNLDILETTVKQVLNFV